MSLDDVKEVVTATLHQRGVLAKLKAELRANVFLAIDEEDRRRAANGRSDDDTGNSAQGLRARGGSAALARREALLSSAEGLLLTDLMRELLAHLGCQFTLRVLEPELVGGDGVDGAGASLVPSRPMLASHLNLHERAVSDEEPLLLGILRNYLGRGCDGPSPRSGGKRRGGGGDSEDGGGSGSGYRPPTHPPSLSPGTARQQFEFGDEEDEQEEQEQEQHEDDDDDEGNGNSGAAEKTSPGRIDRISFNYDEYFAGSAEAADADAPEAPTQELPCASVLTPVEGDDDGAADAADAAATVVVVAATAAAAATTADLKSPPSSADDKAQQWRELERELSDGGSDDDDHKNSSSSSSSEEDTAGEAEAGGDDADLSSGNDSAAADNADNDDEENLAPPAAADESPSALAHRRPALAGAVGAYELGASIQAWPTGAAGGVGGGGGGTGGTAAPEGPEATVEEEAKQEGEDVADWLSAPLPPSFDVATAVYGSIVRGPSQAGGGDGDAAAAGVVVVGGSGEAEDNDEEEERLSLEVGSSVGVNSPPAAARARDSSSGDEEEEDGDGDDRSNHRSLAVSDHSGGLSSAGGARAGMGGGYYDYIEDGEARTTASGSDDE